MTAHLDVCIGPDHKAAAFLGFHDRVFVDMNAIAEFYGTGFVIERKDDNVIANEDMGAGAEYLIVDGRMRRNVAASA
jgi:hypothetical protein